MTKKEKFATKIIEMATNVGYWADNAENYHGSYFDKGYNSGGSNEIVDADVASLEITASQLVSAMTFIENFNKFFENEVVAQADYKATINAIRTDY